MNPARIAVIGNGGGGKTTLSRRLAELHGLPLHHVDSIQYVAGMRTRAVDETRTILDELAAGERWILDGFGPLDVIERRFARATTIVFVDFPLWRHYWWAAKRQVRALRRQRSELPEGCSEAGLLASARLFRILWRVHRVIRPQLLALLEQPGACRNAIRIRTLADWRRVFEFGVAEPG